MKISKLFHWLYAVLMFLPIIAIGVKCGYVMLNKNAVDSYMGTYQYESAVPYSAVNTFDNSNITYTFLNYGNINRIRVYSTDYGIVQSAFIDHKIITNTGTRNIVLNTASHIVVNGYEFDNVTIAFCFHDAPGLYVYDCSSINSLQGFSFLNPSVLYANNTTYTNVYNAFNIDYAKIDFSSSCYYIDLDTQTPNITSKYQDLFSIISYVYDNTLSSVFYSSLQDLDNNEFFGWAKNSFLTAPIMYIGNLFGITNPHPIFTLMSYWLAVSIIWLVFDLVMYLPLLIHRWLDKGVVE